MDTSIGSLRASSTSRSGEKTLSQLLDAARARFEEEEDPLALQKLQEALQIEPDNATALALKSRIENRRSERQIDNWYRLGGSTSTITPTGMPRGSAECSSTPAQGGTCAATAGGGRPPGAGI